MSEYRPSGRTRNYVVPGSFEDLARPTTTCKRLKVVWSTEHDRVTFRMPSRCLDGGDYGAVRFSVLTERKSGDADYAPETAGGDIGVSEWIPRG